MTQRLGCGPFGLAAVDEEKVVVRKGGLTLAQASGKIERSADAFPVRHHRTSWGTTKSSRPKHRRATGGTRRAAVARAGIGYQVLIIGSVAHVVDWRRSANIEYLISHRDKRAVRRWRPLSHSHIRLVIV